MIGDVVIVEPLHFVKTNIILPEIIKRFNGKKMIITIAGMSGSNKTEISTVLQRLLWEKHRIRSKQLHLDDYYLNDYHNRNEARKQTDTIGREEIDWDKLNKVLKRFRSNKKKLYVQRVHLFLDSLEYSISPNHKIQILIIEGLFANYIQDKDFAIYLDGNPKQTYEFRKKRAKENPDDKFRQYVVQRECNCVVQSKQYSDLIIPFNLE